MTRTEKAAQRRSHPTIAFSPQRGEPAVRDTGDGSAVRPRTAVVPGVLLMGVLLGPGRGWGRCRDRPPTRAGGRAGQPPRVAIWSSAACFCSSVSGMKPAASAISSELFT
ncbi:hypothetical protein [Ornithinimicrobium kibberense]|uniref:hypothetical protein n=1 Tax=Ornithinimicrobium kibberense TaxID=282060 RepID=UPI0036075209